MKLNFLTCILSVISDKARWKRNLQFFAGCASDSSMVASAVLTWTSTSKIYGVVASAFL